MVEKITVSVAGLAWVRCTGLHREARHLSRHLRSCYMVMGLLTRVSFKALVPRVVGLHANLGFLGEVL